jgi:hypothetical protein
MTFPKKNGSLLIAALAATVSLAAEARADFLVICPTSTLANWGGSGEGVSTRINAETEQLGQLVDETNVLSCMYPSVSGELSVRVPDDGVCSGTVRFTGENAVFGRTEGFLGNEVPVESLIDQGQCVLRFVGDGAIVLDLVMTEACSFNGDGRSWTCPDNAFPVFQP